MNPTIEHCDRINQTFIGLTIFQKSLFLCMICERLFPVYERYANAETWDNSDSLRDLLDSCWKWSSSLGSTKKPTLPDPSNFLDIIGGQSSSGHANSPFYSIQFLVRSIIEEFPYNEAYPASGALTTIDAYLFDEFYEYSKENEKLVANHPLMVQEMHRQEQNLISVSQENWQENDWMIFKNKMQGENALELLNDAQT